MGRTGYAECAWSVAVLVAEVLADLGFKSTVVGVDSSTQSSFGGTALAEKLQNPLDIAHAVRIVDIANRRQRFRLSQGDLASREVQKAAFQHIQRNVAL